MIAIVSSALAPAAGLELRALAAAAAGLGSGVEVVAPIPDDPAGDRLLLELAAAGVGHAAAPRTSKPLERPDVELALRYLPGVRVIVVLGGEAELLEAAAEAASWWSGSLVAVVPTGFGATSSLPAEAIVIEAPPADPEGTFAGFVAAFAAQLDGGAEAERAWDDTVAALAADRVALGAERGPIA